MKRRRSYEDDNTNPDSPSLKRTKLSNNTNESIESYETYLQNNFNNLVNDKDLKDVIFIVENEQLNGIRALFASHSIVFRQMLYGSMMESQPENHVILTDITIDAFKYLRNTFYNISDSLTSSIVINVLFAAQKYLIKPLEIKCINYIKNISNINELYFVLNKLEESSYQIQSKLYINQIINNIPTYILQYKPIKFIENIKFIHLKYDTIIILITSDNIAASEHKIWEALLKWTEYNAKNNTNCNNNGEETNDVEGENKSECNEKERELMNGFIKYIRFNQMDVNYFKEEFVDKSLLSSEDIINVLLCRENPIKYSSKFNDKQRIKTKLNNTFQLNEVCLTLKEIKCLKIGDLIDFRDTYGLFCHASIIYINHTQNEIKIHYNSWASSYDESYNYNNDEMYHRIAKYGAITNRKIKRKMFYKQIKEFKKTPNNLNSKCMVNLPKLFWQRNQHYFDNYDSYVNKWVEAKMIDYRSSTKYSSHIKIETFINNIPLYYWIHPDNEQEVRPCNVITANTK